MTSKDEAGAWALAALPADLAQTVDKALDVYRGEAVDARWDQLSVLEFTAAMRRLIQQAKG